MLVFRVGMAQVRRHITDFLRIGSGRAHPVLRLAHFGGRHHFHGSGDLLGILDALDLGRISLPPAISQLRCEFVCAQ